MKERLRQALIDQAQTGTPTTYKELADRLGLEPPQTIHRLGEALETLMKGWAARSLLLGAIELLKVPLLKKELEALDSLPCETRLLA